MLVPTPCLRLGFLIAVALIASAGANAEPSGAVAEPYAPKAPASASLKETFKDDFLVGVALNPRQFSDADPQTTAVITHEFNCATAENDMKWEALEPKANTFHFEQADKFIDFCRRHDLVVIGHNLCWHSQLPSWVSKPDPGKETLTKDVLLARLKNHVQTVAAHFKGQVRGWDVVNEAIHDGDGQYRNSVFFRLIGKEYIALAFKWAHEADPNAELYYNDYNLDADDAKRARVIEIVKYLREQGARIDGIGLQRHYNLSTPTVAKIGETIQMFADLGVKVMITELDVEAIRDSHITGAVGANTAGEAPHRELLPAGGHPKVETGTDRHADRADRTALRQGHQGHRRSHQRGRFSAHRRNPRGDGRLSRELLTASQRPPFAELMSERPRGPVGPPPPPLTAEQQRDLAQRYGEIFAMFLKHRPSITRVTFWGLRDSESWRRRSSPLLFDANLQRKPAYDAVIAAAQQARP